MRRALIIATFLSTATWAQAEACTGISLVTTGGGHVHGRTIEWASFDLNSKLIVSPRDHGYTSKLPQERDGLTWKGRYGFVGISVSDDRFIGEGMNEAGLNAGLFYFPGYGSLAPYDPARTANNVADMDLVRWMLSQFSTLGEVRAALDDIRVAPIFIDESGQPSPTAHWRVTDREGGSIVIEIIDGGQVQVYDNQVGVLTNSPGFPWHLLNLNNYVQLEPGTVGPRRFNQLKASSFGAGTAFLGLPGDITPPSRFVRAAFFVATAPTMESSAQAVSQAFHILNNFDIPIGTEFGEAEPSKMPDLPSATQWTAVSDLDQGAFYFKSMHDGAVKRVDLGRIDFAGGQETATALDEGAFRYQDATPQ